MSTEVSVVIYGDEHCPYCTAARMLFTRKGIAFEDISVSGDTERFTEMRERSGRSSVPQIFIGDKHVGGFEELCALDDAGHLEKLLAAD